MDFLINTDNTQLVPEKMEDVFYNHEYDSFMINLNKAEEFVRLAEMYGKFEIIPPDEDYDPPAILFSDAFKM